MMKETSYNFWVLYFVSCCFDSDRVDLVMLLADCTAAFWVPIKSVLFYAELPSSAVSIHVRQIRRATTGFIMYVCPSVRWRGTPRFPFKGLS